MLGRYVEGGVKKIAIFDQCLETMQDTASYSGR